MENEFHHQAATSMPPVPPEEEKKPVITEEATIPDGEILEDTPQEGIATNLDMSTSESTDQSDQAPAETSSDENDPQSSEDQSPVNDVL